MRRNVCPPLVGNPVVAMLLAALVALGFIIPGNAEPTGPNRAATPLSTTKTRSARPELPTPAVRPRATDAEPTPPPTPIVIHRENPSAKGTGRPVHPTADGCPVARQLPAPRLVGIFDHASAPAPRAAHRLIRHALVLRGPPSIA